MYSAIRGYLILSYVHMDRNTTQLPCAQCGTMHVLYFIFELLVDVSSNTDLYDVIIYI